MTGAKIAFAAVTGIGGVASTITGGIVANVPAISNDTPVSLTLGLVFVGMSFIATAAWKISRAWAKMESKMVLLETEVASLRKSRSAAFRERLRALEEAEDASGGRNGSRDPE